jgi:hypothetical protein
MLQDIAIEEFSHLEMVGKLIAQHTSDMDQTDVYGAPLFKIEGGDPHFLDSLGSCWTAAYINEDGNVVRDLRADIAAEAGARQTYERGWTERSGSHLKQSGGSEQNMKHSITLLTSATMFAAALSGTACSQGAPQTVSLMKVDPQTVATGYRTSKLVGSTVVNEAGETVGTIDDLIVTPNGTAPYAVLSIGGFLGMGTKYVVVPFPSLQVKDKKMVLPGATKDALRALPDFKYNAD